MGELRKQLTQQTAAVEEGKTKRSEVEQALQVSEKECNHWKQKSMQQDMVLQTKTQVSALFCLQFYSIGWSFPKICIFLSMIDKHILEVCKICTYYMQ